MCIGFVDFGVGGWVVVCVFVEYCYLVLCYGLYGWVVGG